MADPVDVIVPILQRLQGDLADTRRSLEAKINDIAEEQLKQGDKLDAIERYMIFHMGLTTQQKADIETLQSDMENVKKRLAALEAQP